MANKYDYAGGDFDEIQRRSKQRSGRYDRWLTEDVTWFKPRQGENCIRMLPWIYKSHEKYPALVKRWTRHWGLDVFIHYKVGAGGKGSYLCLDKMLGQPCPICDVAISEGIEELEFSHRILARLIDRNNEKEGPMFWTMPLSVSNDISLASQIRSSKSAPDEGKWLVIDHWDTGHDVFMDVEGEGDRRRYKRIYVDPNPSYLSENEGLQQKWLDEVFTEPLLPEMLKYYDAEHIRKVLMGQKEAGDEGDGANERGSSDRGARRGRPDDGAASGDREERTSRRPLEREADDSDNTATRRGADTEGRTSSRGGDRNERGGVRGGSEDSPTPRRTRERLPEAEEQDPPWKGERDKEAETANEGREAVTSRREDAGSARSSFRENLKERVGRTRG